MDSNPATNSPAGWASAPVGLLTLLFWVVSCGPGDGSTLDERGRALDHPYAPGLASRYGLATIEASYESIALDFFGPYCVECHGGATTSKGLDLTFEAAYDDMVEVRAAQRSDLQLVEPGMPKTSYLVIKLVGGPAMVGRQMPRGRPARPEAEIDAIREWIESGAPRD